MGIVCPHSCTCMWCLSVCTHMHACMYVKASGGYHVSLSLSLPGSHKSTLASWPVSPRGPPAFSSPALRCQATLLTSASYGCGYGYECMSAGDLNSDLHVAWHSPTAPSPALQTTVFLTSTTLTIHKTSQNIPVGRALLLQTCPHQSCLESS